MYLTQAIHRAVQQGPDRAYTVCGDRLRTVVQSAERIALLAGALRDLGVAPGDRVGILAFNSDRYHEYLLAVPWADAVLNPINVRWSSAEIAYALLDSGTRVLLVDEAFTPMLPALREEAPNLLTVVFCGDGEGPAGTVEYEKMLSVAAPIEDARRGGDDLLGVFYTSGTTGSPKGVMLSHNNLLASAMGCLAAGSFVSEGGRYLNVAPMFHVAGLGGWAAAMLVDSSQVILPVFSPAAVLAAIAEYRITDLLLVPTMLQMLMDAPEFAVADLSSVSRVLYGASPISDQLLVRARNAFPAAGFIQGYGMTELGGATTLLRPKDHDVSDLLRAAGRSAPHAEVCVMGLDDNEVPRGMVGEIAVRGDHVMLGYWERPAETARALRGGWMHTGDIGYLDCYGYLFVVDRLKDMIVTGGENVFSAEVEKILAKHPGVVSCAVIGVPDDRWGERVHAVIVPRPGQSVTDDELRAFCRAQIAGYKVPRSLEYVDQLPLSGAGKILKHELRERYWGDCARQIG
ncbi:long-chain-fatty-acid--CoA ligase [Mycobacterium sp.]|uniref:long-chain-fatty-acid--CoA ligase n=1 Tax=Mycobacterium sp. TaxID=1785 RepID=UPI003D6B23D7